MLVGRAVDDTVDVADGALTAFSRPTYLDLTVSPPVVRFDVAGLRSLAFSDRARAPRDLLSATVKRAFDVAVAVILLVLLAPLLVVVALVVYLGDGGPVFYRQTRVGRHGREFEMIKFRSMVVAADSMRSDVATDNVGTGLLFKIQNDPRITPVGRVLRRLSLDELPQFINVLRGDMSLVGPRPLPVNPDSFDELANQRHAVRPGITGPWQVAGNDMQRYEDMIRLDLRYVASRSFARDLVLLGRTPLALLLRGSGDR